MPSPDPVPVPSLADRLAEVRVAFNLRRVPLAAIGALLDDDAEPRPGDLVLARVDELGHHTRLQLTTGRRVQLFEGDEIAVAYGHRYATEQFEAEVPRDLSPCHLVAAGGIAGRAISRSRNVRRPTRITPLGLLATAGGAVCNLADFALPPRDALPAQRPLTVAVLGTGMDVGKTTTARHLVKGLTRAGLRVGAAKVTGTGACGDYFALADSGAVPVFDIVDAGFASTWRLAAGDVLRGFTTLLAHVVEHGVEAVVIEVADGLLQPETATLIAAAEFAAAVDSVLLAAREPLAAGAAIERLRGLGLPCVAVSGLVSASNLGVEEARSATGLAVLGLRSLGSPSILHRVLPRVPQAGGAPA
ncbi:MAG: DUF1611 domain-containing protein [Planctomycetes bacterium]|nr:DUF1611 domain-containing protein [Planctomycetota bacterium]